MILELTLAALMLLSAPDEESGQKPKKRDGLNTQQSNLVDKIYGDRDERDTFEKQVDEITASGKPESILILTHLMIELPWQPELAPKSLYDTRMPKLFVEHKLDELVASSKHDQLSAEYFRSLIAQIEKNPNAEQRLVNAKTKLIEWTIEHLDKFKWDDDRFVLKE